MPYNRRDSRPDWVTDVPVTDVDDQTFQVRFQSPSISLTFAARQYEDSGMPNPDDMLELVVDNTRDIVITIVDSNGKALDLTGATGASLALTTEIGTAAYQTFSTGGGNLALGGAAGTLTCTVTAPDAAGWPVGVSVGHGEVTYASGSHKLERFYVNVLQDIS